MTDDLDELCDCGEPNCARVNELLLKLEAETREALGAEEQA